jgi:multicomponent Na+:H+ antiporter subunit B
VSSLILRVSTRIMMGLLILFSLFLLLRGHDAPGGGFVGGLVAAAAYILYMISDGVQRARAALPASPRILIGAGLTVAAASGAVPLFLGAPFLTGVWGGALAPALASVGTPVVFDGGVYLVVVGVTLSIMFGLAEE